MSRLDEIKERAEKATAGPWYCFDIGKELYRGDDYQPAYSVCTQAGLCDKDCPNNPHCHECIIYGPIFKKENAEFINACREDIPYLLEEVDTTLKQHYHLCCEIERLEHELKEALKAGG